MKHFTHPVELMEKGYGRTAECASASNSASDSTNCQPQRVEGFNARGNESLGFATALLTTLGARKLSSVQKVSPFLLVSSRSSFLFNKSLTDARLLSKKVLSDVYPHRVRAVISCETSTKEVSQKIINNHQNNFVQPKDISLFKD